MQLLGQNPHGAMRLKSFAVRVPERYFPTPRLSARRIGCPLSDRSGARPKNPSLASQSAWFLRSGFILPTSWMTTTPGQGSPFWCLATYAVKIAPSRHNSHLGHHISSSRPAPLVSSRAVLADAMDRVASSSARHAVREAPNRISSSRSSYLRTKNIQLLKCSKATHRTNHTNPYRGISPTLSFAVALLPRY